MPVTHRHRVDPGADPGPGFSAESAVRETGSRTGSSRRKTGTARDVAAAVIGIAILVFVTHNLTRPFMRWPSALQGTAICFLLALAAAMFYPLIRDKVDLKRLSGKWRLVARGAIAVFFMTLLLLLRFGRVSGAEGGDTTNLPVASVNGLGAADLAQAPRHVTLRGPLDEEEAVALWWSAEGVPQWSGPIPASLGLTGWEATLDFASPVNVIYRVLAMPATTSPSQCRKCVPLRLAVADVDAAIDSIAVDGMAATLMGKFVNPGGEYDLHLLRSDSVSPADDWEEVSQIRVSAGAWTIATELREAYHYPNAVTLRVAGLRHGGGPTVPLVQRTLTVPAPVLTIRKIHGQEMTDGPCAVDSFSQVTIEGKAAHLLDSEQIWVRLENFDTSADNLALRRVAAKRTGPSDWSAKVSISAGREIRFEAVISDSDPGRQPAAFTSAAVTCFSTTRR